MGPEGRARGKVFAWEAAPDTPHPAAAYRYCFIRTPGGIGPRVAAYPPSPLTAEAHPVSIQPIPRPSPAGQQLYTTVDVARLCHVKPSTVREWARRGRLPGGFRLGKYWRWPAAEVERFLGIVGQEVAHAS